MNLWKITNIVLLLLYVFEIYYYLFSKKKYLVKIFSNIFHVILLLLGIYASRLGKIEDIFLYLIAGFLYLPVMIFFNSPNLKFFLNFQYKFFKWLQTIYQNFNIYKKILLRTLYEELLWRCAFVYISQQLQFEDLIIVTVGTLLFYIMHIKINIKIIFLSEIEFLIFSAILYTIFVLSGSLITVWGIHFTRNSYLQFVKKNYNVK